MAELIALAFVLSMDNVRLAGALGVLETSARRRWCLALLMVAVESGFPLAGAATAPAWLDRVAGLTWLGPLAFLVAVALFLAGDIRKPLLGADWMLYTLPVLFGIDNLLAGAAFGQTGTHGLGALLVVGLLSGAASLTTVIAVARVAAPLAPRWRVVQLVVIVALALSFIVFP